LSQSEPLIAVVEDDESVCSALDRLLHSLGMNAQTFASGGEFLAFIDEIPSFHPDCLVLDLHMPGMSGLAVQERLAKEGNSIPIIFITAHDEVDARDRALQRGAVAFLRKPFSIEALMDALNKAAHKRSGK